MTELCENCSSVPDLIINKGDRVRESSFKMVSIKENSILIIK